MKIFKDFGPLLVKGFSSEHNGIDIIGNDNNSQVKDYIVSVEDGIVEEISNDEEKNEHEKNYIIIKHINGITIKYSNLTFNDLSRQVNEEIKRGEIIGYTEFEYLHLEFKNDTGIINPTPYIFENNIDIDSLEKVFTCLKDDSYYIKLRKNDELYLLRKKL